MQNAPNLTSSYRTGTHSQDLKPPMVKSDADLTTAPKQSEHNSVKLIVSDFLPWYSSYPLDMLLHNENDEWKS